jgi:hypothetical protein
MLDAETKAVYQANLDAYNEHLRTLIQLQTDYTALLVRLDDDVPVGGNQVVIDLLNGLKAQANTEAAAIVALTG